MDTTDASYSLTDVDIERCLPGIKVWLYPDLAHVNSLDEILDLKGRAVILFLTTSDTAGHWVGLWKDSRTRLSRKPDQREVAGTVGSCVHYFDSYGKMRPDDEQKWLSQQMRKRLKETKPLLTNLIKKGGYKTQVNPIQYQGHQDWNNECGRHVVSRLFFHTDSDTKYKTRIAKSGMSPDDFVLTLTNHLLEG